MILKFLPFPPFPVDFVFSSFPGKEWHSDEGLSCSLDAREEVKWRLPFFFSDPSSFGRAEDAKMVAAPVRPRALPNPPGLSFPPWCFHLFPLPSTRGCAI